MRSIFGVGAVVLCMGACAFGASATAPTTQSSGELRIQSVRISRTSEDLQKEFQGRYYTEGSAGVSLQLLLTLQEAAVLPLNREAINIDTFVDDTYQNLLASDRGYSGYSGNSPVVSGDGQMILFTVVANHPPADDAGRIFVRGTIAAQMARGPEKTVSAKLSLAPGEHTNIGGFDTTVRSVADSGGYAGRSQVSLQLAIDGDASRIRGIRILSTDGKPLNDEHENRFLSRNSPNSQQPSLVTVNLGAGPAPQSATVEYSFVDKVESVRIPFQAQVDLGQTKIGPIEPSSHPGRADAAPHRPWPPLPPSEQPPVSFGESRDILNPSTRPDQNKLTQAGVDLFSLTVAKPAPWETKSVKWANPPAPAFHASGYTVARLMLSIPNATILSLSQSDPVVVTKFSDNKGGELDATVFGPTTPNGYVGAGYYPFTIESPDTQQSLITISLPSTPTPGATRCTLRGMVHAQIARNNRVDAGHAIPFVKGQDCKVGPFEVHLSDIRQEPQGTPRAPALGMAPLQVYLALSGPIQNLHSIELVDGDTGQRLGESAFHTSTGDRATSSTSAIFFLRQSPPKKVIVRLGHFDKTETATIPFDLTTGIGL